MSWLENWNIVTTRKDTILYAFIFCKDMGRCYFHYEEDSPLPTYHSDLSMSLLSTCSLCISTDDIFSLHLP